MSHRVDISDKSRKKFTTPFIETVKHLHVASQGDEKTKVEAFKNLVNEFGTHYAAITDLGTKLSIERRYSAKERASSGTNEISECNTLVGSQIFGFQTEMGRYNCSKDNLMEKGLVLIIDTVGVPKSTLVSQSVSKWVSNVIENLLLFY